MMISFVIDIIDKHITELDEIFMTTTDLKEENKVLNQMNILEKIRQEIIDEM